MPGCPTRVGVLLVVQWRQPVFVILGVVLLGFAWLLRPRLGPGRGGRVDDGVVVLDRSEAPALHAVLDDVADVVGRVAAWPLRVLTLGGVGGLLLTGTPGRLSAEYRADLLAARTPSPEVAAHDAAVRRPIRDAVTFAW